MKATETLCPAVEVTLNKQNTIFYVLVKLLNLITAVELRIHQYIHGSVLATIQHIIPKMAFQSILPKMIALYINFDVYDHGEMAV